LGGRPPRPPSKYAHGSVNAIGTSPAGTVAKYCDECVCLCVWLSDGISPEPHTRFLPLFAHVAYVHGTLTIGRIAYRREWGDGSAQRGRSVIYDCLVFSEFDTTDTHVTDRPTFLGRKHRRAPHIPYYIYIFIHQTGSKIT